MEEIAGFHGPEEVIFYSQDNKANVPIRLTAANKQVPLVIHVEYNVKLPDHNFVITKQHKLVQLVIGNMQVKAKTFSQDAVTYSGPTYIGIRSAKHLGLKVYNHHVDMKQICVLAEFERSSKDEEKLVMVMTVGWGPDENTRHKKTISCAVDYFNTNDLEVFFLVTNTPGCSTLNRVKRKMAPLAKS